MEEFVGDPAPLRDLDFEQAAKTLGCSVAAIRAVALVESAGGGFLADARPKILFERHIFHARTGGRYGAEHPRVSSPRRGGYRGGAGEYARLNEAMLIDRKVALEATSWGKFQIMGFNHARCNHSSVEGFVKAMVSGEPAQLSAFVAFLNTCKLDDELVRQDWAAFARGYNGSAYIENAYGRKLADAYARFSSGSHAMPLLRCGDRGHGVARLQELLGQISDGLFGAATKLAVVTFQKAKGLTPDGVVGAQTWNALLG